MIKAVIFDLGGTLIDKFSLSPLVNLSKAFKQRNIVIPNRIISQDMGKNKFDHIYSISREPIFYEQFKNIYKRDPNDSDLGDIYSIFCVFQREDLRKKQELIPETKMIMNYLKEQNIKIGITTGFNKEQMDLVLDRLNKEDIYPDSAVSSSCIDNLSRPNPSMIYWNMNLLGITNPMEVIKVDDTNVGIQEGLNAGCISVGVARWSINMGVLTEEERQELEDDTNRDIIKDKLEISRDILQKSGASNVIDTLDELPIIIETSNFAMLSRII